MEAKDVAGTSAEPFESWLRGKRFVSIETRQPTPYIMLSVKQKLDIKKQYEKEMVERVGGEKADELKRVEDKKIEAERRKAARSDPSDPDYPWTAKKIAAEARKWGRQIKSDFPEEQRANACADTAENFLLEFPGIKKFYRQPDVPYLIKNEATIKDIITDYIYDGAS